MQSRPYPSPKQAVGLLLMVFLLQLLVGFLVGMVVSAVGLGEDSAPAYVLFFWLLPLVSFGIPILHALRLSGRSPAQLFSKRTGPELYCWVCFMFAGLAVVLSELENLINYVIPRSEVWIELFAAIMGPNLVLALIAVGVIVPVVEETLFRGIILSGFVHRYGEARAILFSSLLFGLLHLNPWQAIPAFISGLLLGWVFTATWSLLPVIFAHGVYNSLIVVAYYTIDVPGLTDPAAAFQPLWLSLTGLAIVVVSMQLFRMRQAPGPSG